MERSKDTGDETKVSCITETRGVIIKIGSNFVHVASVTIRVDCSTTKCKC